MSPWYRRAEVYYFTTQPWVILWKQAWDSCLWKTLHHFVSVLGYSYPKWALLNLRRHKSFNPCPLIHLLLWHLICYHPGISLLPQCWIVSDTTHDTARPIFVGDPTRGDFSDLLQQADIPETLLGNSLMHVLGLFSYYFAIRNSN